MALLGPLGIAVLLGLVGYAFYKWAEDEESTRLDRWARRCYFGKHNEDPPIHWNKPEHAHIAIAELNAATLGVEAGVNFRLRIVGSDSHGWGGPIGSVGAPIYEQHLEYRLVLPLFDANRSAYRWSMTVHRYGDGSANQYTGGEVLAEGELNPPPWPPPSANAERRWSYPNARTSLITEPTALHPSRKYAPSNWPTPVPIRSRTSEAR
ncbi:hypothetical protein VRB68_09295 [Pseudomonas trivialis]